MCNIVAMSQCRDYITSYVINARSLQLSAFLSRTSAYAFINELLTIVNELTSIIYWASFYEAKIINL